MTYHEAAMMLERIIDDDWDLTPRACEALMMGIDALEEKERMEDDRK